MVKPGPARLLAQVQKAWHLRFQGKNREAEALLDTLEEVEEPALGHQVALLRVSLLRAAGQLADSNAELERLAPLIQAARSLTEPLWKQTRFHFYLQRAINLYSADDFSPSLEFYLLAAAQTNEASEQLVCQINVLGCLENLNLPSRATVSEVEKLLKKRPTPLSQNPCANN